MNFANNWNIFTDFMKSQQADTARAAGDAPAAPDPARDLPADREAARETALSEAITVGMRDSTDHRAHEIPSRQPVLGDWFMEGDLGFIYAPRGLGKTWFALGLATAVANGRAFGPWTATAPRRVLYVDGEMPCEALDARIGGMGESRELIVLNHEELFHFTGEVLNLATPAAQRALTGRLLAQGIGIVFLDNLSCLFSGMKENDADDWESVLGWLLTLRRHRIAVVVVHHSGRNKETMRGTSRREDAAFWVIRLDAVNDEQRDGAAFRSEFTKDRNSRREQSPYEWTFQTLESGVVEVKAIASSGLETLREWIACGLTSAEDIAREMGVSKGTISKMAQRAIADGWLGKRGREYFLR
ncbi:hypothetical protein DB345_17855 [Spartobacteria bacterium LR76]|nr:hypothetical protein DB345_17855 [Spartobacteria bacterium LR76]